MKLKRQEENASISVETDDEAILRTRRAARWAGGLFLFGALASVLAAIFIATSWQETLSRSVFAVFLVLAGVLLWRLPWDRWPLSYLLGVVPLAFLFIWLHEWWVGFTPYTYPLAFVLVYVWIGLALPRWAPWGFSPLLVLAYVLPKLGDTSALQAGVLAVTTCLLVGESISIAINRLRRYRDEFRRRAEIFHGVAQAAREISSLDSNALANEIVSACRRLGFDVACLIRFLPGGEQASMSAASGLSEALQGQSFPLNEGIGLAVWRERAAVTWYQDQIEQEGCAILRDNKLTVAHAEPIMLGEEMLAVLVVGYKGREQVSLEEQVAVEIVALEASVALGNAERFADEQRQSLDFRDQSLRDALTGLGNRRLLDALVQDLTPDDAILAIDLDHFKWVNDHFGHDRGDETLVQMGEFLQASLREGDVAVRHGGEEFIVLMPKAGAHAEEVANRLLERWRESEPVTTFSMGLALHRPGASAEETLKRADEALYAAKRGGRNRLVLAH